MEIDIPEVARPIIRKTRKIEAIRTAKKVRTELMTEKNKLDHLLTDFILLVEGFYKYIPSLKKEKVKNILDDTRDIIPTFDSINEDLKKEHYLNDVAFKEKFRYSIRVVYRLESLLHITYTKDLSIQKTPEYIKEGLSKISSEAVANSLSKRR